MRLTACVNCRGVTRSRGTRSREIKTDEISRFGDKLSRDTRIARRAMFSLFLNFCFASEKACADFSLRSLCTVSCVTPCTIPPPLSALHVQCALTCGLHTH